MEDYLEGRKEEEALLTNKSTDGRKKQSQDKAAGGEMKERAMERLAQTKRRDGEDEARKKRLKRNNTLDVLRESTERESQLKHDELDIKRNQDEATRATQQALLTQLQDWQRLQMQQQQQQFIQMMQIMFNSQRAQSHRQLLNYLKRVYSFEVDIVWLKDHFLCIPSYPDFHRLIICNQMFRRCNTTGRLCSILPSNSYTFQMNRQFDECLCHIGRALQVHKLYSAAYFLLYNHRRVRKYLSQETCEHLVQLLLPVGSIIATVFYTVCLLSSLIKFSVYKTRV